MKGKCQTGILAITLVVFAWAPSRWVMAQNEPQPSTGPQPPVGETVLVPKKTAPAPAPKSSEQNEKINPNNIYTLSTSTSLVNVETMVVDRYGNPISNLGKKNFRISDDGVPQSLSNFAVAEAPMTVCMLIEFRNHRVFWEFLYLALQHAYSFVDFIRPKDWVAVVAFDMKPDILTDFTQDRSEVIGALDRLRIPGFSEANLWDALAFTIDRMKDIQGRKAILLICTGIDTFSKLTYDKALKIAKTSDAAIYPISILEFMSVRYGDNIDTMQAKNALNTIAEYSGGKAYFPRFEAELNSIYEQISAQLRSHYSLGFVPTNTTRDGKYHKLKVELVDPQGSPLRIVDQKGKDVKYRVVARDGYYAPKS